MPLTKVILMRKFELWVAGNQRQLKFVGSREFFTLILKLICSRVECVVRGGFLSPHSLHSAD